MISAPTVMVSSTFYDLRQVRKDIGEFLSHQLGYRCLLSELPSFPIDPDLDTIENCKRRVEQQADIFVLVVGGRYGSVDPKSAKSVTNLEYITARRKGIPVYAFITKQVLQLLPVWERNPDGHFSAIVEAPQLFEFVRQIRDEERVWAFPFETAQEIVETLRAQLAHLFASALALRRQTGGTTLPSHLEQLSAKALRLALEEPEAWEYRLFFQVWCDSIDERFDMVSEYEMGLRLGDAEAVGVDEATDWVVTKLHELRGLIESANRLLNESAKEAFGLPGEPGDARMICWVAKKMGSVYEALIQWSLRVRRANVEEPFDHVVQQVSMFADDTIRRLKAFPESALSKLDDALTGDATDKPIVLEFTLTFELSNLAQFERALRDAERQLFG